jgi:hypothetical protein
VLGAALGRQVPFGDPKKGSGRLEITYIYIYIFIYGNVPTNNGATYC